MFKLVTVYVFFAASIVYSQDTLVAPDVDIISVSPVQGSGLSIDRVPGKIQTLSRDQLGKKKNSFGTTIFISFSSSLWL